MQDHVSDIAFTPAVKRLQSARGSRQTYERMEQNGGWRQAITPELRAFIAERDSFYLGTANAGGQPYIQHRGGKPGFLKVLDAHNLAFADFRGNRQYISAGNLSENAKAFIFLMDYAHRRRIKIWGHARMVEDMAISQQLADGDYPGQPEQAIVFTVEAWDINCPQHITRRYTQAEVEQALAPLRQRIATLEAQLANTSFQNPPIDQEPSQ